MENKFLLTHPVWDVTKTLFINYASVKFLLTHPVWDVTIRVDDMEGHEFISTHTSRVGCDGITGWRHFLYHISTHTSRVGCDRYI